MKSRASKVAAFDHPACDDRRATFERFRPMRRRSAKGRTGARPAAFAGTRAAGYPHARHEGPDYGIGSGFILSSDGYILTNARLVAGAREASVLLADQRKFKAKFIGRDPQSEIALLKIVADAAGIEHRRSDEAEGCATGGRRGPGAQLRGLGNSEDRLGDVLFAPGQRLRSIYPHRCRDRSAQFWRGIVRFRR